MPRSAPALLTVCTLLTLACAAPAGSSPFGSKPSAVTPEELLAVLAAPQDTDGSPDGEWWPGLPQFNAELEGPGTLPGERFWVARRFQRLGEAEVTLLETALTLYDDDVAAAAAFGAWASTLDRGGEPGEGPPLADEHRYFTRVSTSEGHETTVRRVV